jgi:hypothetical protein
MKPWRGATMSRIVNDFPNGVPDADLERIMPTKLAMGEKKNIALVAHDKKERGAL